MLPRLHTLDWHFAGVAKPVEAKTREQQLLDEMVNFYTERGVLPLIEFSSQLEPEYEYTSKDVGSKLKDRVWFGPSRNCTNIESQIFVNNFNKLFSNAYIISDTQQYITKPDLLETKFNTFNEHTKDLYAFFINVGNYHWVSFVITKKATSDRWYGLFFDSFAEKATEYLRINAYIQGLIKVFKSNKSIKDERFEYYENDKTYQNDDSECGVWALYFILMVNWRIQTAKPLDNTVFNDLISISERKQKQDLRNVFFRQQEYEAPVDIDPFRVTKKSRPGKKPVYVITEGSEGEKAPSSSSPKGEAPENPPTTSTDMAETSVPRSPTSSVSGDTGSSSGSDPLKNLMHYERRGDGERAPQQNAPQKPVEVIEVISDEEQPPATETSTSPRPPSTSSSGSPTGGRDPFLDTATSPPPPPKRRRTRMRRLFAELLKA